MAASIRLIPLAVLASGVMLWLASPAVGVGWLAWVAIVPVAVVVLSHPGGRGARLAVPVAYVVYLELLIVPAFPLGLAEGQWGDPVLPVLIRDSPVFAIALVAVPLVGVGLYLLRFGEPWGAARMPGRLAGVAAVAIPALAWTGLDFARAKLDPGGLWGPLFLSQAGEPAGALAGLAGPWLVTLAIVAVNYGIATALVRRRLVPALVPAIAVVGFVAAATVTEGRADDGTTLRLGAVQPGYDTAESDRPELRNFRRGSYDLAALDLIGDLGELTREASAAGAELVVWPEASMYVDPREETEVRQALEELVEETGTAVVVPFFRPSPAGEGEVLAMTPSLRGPRFTRSRPKHRPLWIIGERGADVERGPIALDGYEIGALLGVDTQDARNGASLAADGAELLVSATHDWRQSAVPASAYARLGARAAGAPLARADWRYGSAIYAGDGEIVADAGSGRARVSLVADVRLAERVAPYARIGDAVGWLALAIAALTGAVAIGSALRSRGVSGGGGRAGGDRAPDRGPRPRPPSPGRPRAGAGPTRRPP